MRCLMEAELNLSKMKAIIKLGFEKISVNTLLLTNPLEVKEIVKNFGSSTVQDR